MKKILNSFLYLIFLLISQNILAYELPIDYSRTFGLYDNYEIINEKDDKVCKIIYTDFFNKKFEFEYSSEFCEGFTKTHKLAEEKNAILFHTEKNDRGNMDLGLNYTEKY